MVRSTVKPDEVFVKDKIEREDGLYLVLRFRDNIREVEIQSDDKTSHKEFEYDEVESELKVPEVISMTELAQFIQSQRTQIVGASKLKNELKSLPIETVRQKVVEESVALKSV
jgi:hypothetical protein